MTQNNTIEPWHHSHTGHYVMVPVHSKRVLLFRSSNLSDMTKIPSPLAEYISDFNSLFVISRRQLKLYLIVWGIDLSNLVSNVSGSGVLLDLAMIR
jgi:hypothetical protein